MGQWRHTTLPKRYAELAEALDDLALHLKAEGKSGLAREYQLASSAMKTAEHMPPDPSDIDDVSVRTRDSIEIDKLTELREKRPYLSKLTKVKSLGPKTAKQINEETGAETLDDLERLLESGEIENIHGVGSKTSTTFRRSLAQLNRKT